MNLHRETTLYEILGTIPGNVPRHRQYAIYPLVIVKREDVERTDVLCPPCHPTSSNARTCQYASCRDNSSAACPGKETCCSRDTNGCECGSKACADDGSEKACRKADDKTTTCQPCAIEAKQPQTKCFRYLPRVAKPIIIYLRFLEFFCASCIDSCCSSFSMPS